ncbi:MAG: HAMP domain-containing sensor histidine kinase [Phycisphaeraceae bacterium]
MRKPVRISLANKCQLLFGSAIVLILAAALAIGWGRMYTLVIEGQQETARRLADAWLDGLTEIPKPFRGEATHPSPSPAEEGTDPAVPAPAAEAVLFMSLHEREAIDAAPADTPFIEEAIRLFDTRDDKHEHFQEVADAEGRRLFAYARAVRKSDLIRIHNRLIRQFGEATISDTTGRFTPGIDTTALADPLRQVLVVKFRADLADRQLMLNRIYIVAAGLAAGVLAIGTFWYITTRIILSPVRVLRDTAEKVAEGGTDIRSDINTGDEFEQLSDVFNAMLERLHANENELRKANRSLDLKLGELAETNVALYEANKIKGEFLANVSHELRTPLNSIIGFAQVLKDAFADGATSQDEKRRRYAENIIISSQRLLDLINDLLDLAKIEAGRMEVHLGPVNVPDTLEGLATLIRPQAEKAGLQLVTKAARTLPVVQTDAGKVHQVLFNFLSNAVKFTPRGGTVTMSAQMMDDTVTLRSGERRIRFSVADTGPGIPLSLQDRIFEKFTQLDTSVTRTHGGTGLGLTISRDLAKLLQGRIELDSDEGKGATFHLIVPVEFKSASTPLMPAAGAAR